MMMTIISTGRIWFSPKRTIENAVSVAGPAVAIAPTVLRKKALASRPKYPKIEPK